MIRQLLICSFLILFTFSSYLPMSYKKHNFGDNVCNYYDGEDYVNYVRPCDTGYYCQDTESNDHGADVEHNLHTCQKYMYIPEAQNDFVYAVVCEEMGLIGAILILLVFVLLVWRGITISMRAKDPFGSMLGTGLAAQIGIQAILNILVITDWLPNTGISLPFFSYGGTSLIMLMAQMGIVLSISRTSNLEKV